MYRGEGSSLIPLKSTVLFVLINLIVVVTPLIELMRPRTVVSSQCSHESGDWGLPFKKSMIHLEKGVVRPRRLGFISCCGVILLNAELFPHQDNKMRQVEHGVLCSSDQSNKAHFLQNFVGYFETFSLDCPHSTPFAPLSTSPHPPPPFPPSIPAIMTVPDSSSEKC